MVTGFRLEAVGGRKGVQEPQAERKFGLVMADLGAPRPNPFVLREGHMDKSPGESGGHERRGGTEESHRQKRRGASFQTKRLLSDQEHILPLSWDLCPVACVPGTGWLSSARLWR